MSNLHNPYPPFRPLVAVVGFHHHRGPEIESWFGVPDGVDPAIDNDWSFLPFMAMADGAHASTEDFTYFTLRRKPVTPTDAPATTTSDAALSDHNDPTSPQLAAPRPINPAIRSETLASPRASTTDAPAQSSRGTTPSAARAKYGAGASVFAMSCTRQLRADQLINKTSDVTRSTVQKSVVVLLGSRPGRFAGWRDKLAAVTRSWFLQRDFEDREILKHFQESLVESERTFEYEPDHFLGISLRQFIYDFRQDALVLFKCALLQPKVLFFGEKTEKICMIQFALISLIPGLIRYLEDCADPDLDTFAQQASMPTSLRTSDRDSLLTYMGLPLQIFGAGGFFNPYTPLQQLDLLFDRSTLSYIIGSTNDLLLQDKVGGPEVVVDVDKRSIQWKNPGLKHALGLTAADRRWMDSILQTVASTWDPENPSQPTTHSYLGSEDFIRFQFEEYVCSLLASAKYEAYISSTPPGRRDVLASPELSSRPTADFGDHWMERWKQTSNYALWNKFTDSHLFDIVEPKHPTAGGLSVEDVQRRFAQQIESLHLDDRVAAGREVLNKHLVSGQERFSKAFSGLWAEIEARREANAKRWGEHRSEQASSPPPPPPPTATEKNDQAAGMSRLGGAGAAATYGEAAALRASQASAAMAATGQRSMAYLSSFGAWASEKSKGWRQASTSDLRAAGTDDANKEKPSAESTRSPSLASRGGLGWPSKNGGSLMVSTDASGLTATIAQQGYNDARTPEGGNETFWDHSTAHSRDNSDASVMRAGSSGRDRAAVNSPPQTPVSPTGSGGYNVPSNGAGGHSQGQTGRGLSKRVSGRFGGPRGAKSKERIIDGIGRIDAP